MNGDFGLFSIINLFLCYKIKNKNNPYGKHKTTLTSFNNKLNDNFSAINVTNISYIFNYFPLFLIKLNVNSAILNDNKKYINRKSYREKGGVLNARVAEKLQHADIY